MKFSIYVLLIIILLSCVDQQLTPSRKISATQKNLYDRLDSFEHKVFNAPNDIAKQEARDNFKESLDSYFADSLKYRLDSFKVHASTISVHDFNDVWAFTATFWDKKGVEYWLEFDYPKNQKAALEANPVFKLLKDMPLNVDTTLNLFYMGEVSFDVISSNRIRIRAIPLPAGFNVDSVSKSLNQ